MLSKTLSIGESKWGLKEGESSMNPNFAVENLSVSLQSCEPFCTTKIDFSKSSVAEDTLRTDVLVGALNSISIVEPSGQKDDEVKDAVRYWVIITSHLDGLKLGLQQNYYMYQVDSGLKDDLVLGDPDAPRFVLWNGKLRPVPSKPTDFIDFDRCSLIKTTKARNRGTKKQTSGISC